MGIFSGRNGASGGSKSEASYATPGGGLAVSIAAFRAGVFRFSGGSVTLPSNGTWYVGVDLFRKVAISLPRLGHRGWVPVAEVIAAGGQITSITPIAPVLPASRIPRTMKKLASGQNINALVMGSSLAEGSTTATDYWGGMLFAAASSPNAYRVPNVGTFSNIALGGTPNQYQLAQTGRASQYVAGAGAYSDGGFPAMVRPDKPPRGRSTIFTGVDLVVLTCLANGGDYRLECIEPIIRNLRKLGCEVIVTTDNPQSWDGQRSTVDNASLYIDGPEVMRIAELYGIEVVDTAAYVVDAQIRYLSGEYPNVIYRDSIHMAFGAPAGRTAAPAGGYEVWARAVRSCMTVEAVTYGTVVKTIDFNDGTTGPFVGQTAGVVSNRAGVLRVTKNGSANSQWGAWNPTGDKTFTPFKNGDTVRVQGKLVDKSAGFASGPVVGLQGGGSGWASGPAANFSLGTVGSTFDVTLTANRDNLVAPQILFFGNWDAAPDGTYFEIDDLIITINSTYTSAAVDLIPGRPGESRPLPPVRKVTDYKTPGDAFVILPPSELYAVAGLANKGTLGASLAGGNSFARRFSSAVGSTVDMLTVASGQIAQMGGVGTVGLAMIYQSANGDAAVTFDLYRNNSLLQGGLSIPAQTIQREQYFELINPTSYNRTIPDPNNDCIEIRVTSGTLRIAALVVLTSDLDIHPPEYIQKFGTWTQKVANPRGPNLKGFGTDVANDYAMAWCPPDAMRLSWLVSSNPVSQSVDTFSGRASNLSISLAGTNHCKLIGHVYGPGEWHYILNKTANSAGNTDGYALHIGGVVIVNDR